MSQETIILLLIISVICSAFFAGVEMAFVSSNKFKVELDKNKENFTGRLLAIVTKSPNRFIGTMLIGNNIALVVFGMMAALLIEPPIETLYLSWFHAAPKAVVILTQTILSTIFILITAEFLPKAVSSLNPNRFLNLFILPTTVFYYLLQVPVRFTIFLSNIILRYIFNAKIKEEEVTFEKTDLNYYLQQVSNSHVDTQVEVQNEVKILQNVLDFPSVRAKECMRPRTEITAIEVGSSIKELKDLFIESGHSKVLIYRDTIDDIIGFAHSYDMFQKPADLRGIVKPILFVPETMFIKDILTQFIQQHRSIAVVVDEYGGTAGMLTLEDIIEQIFGEIDDELDVEENVEKKISDTEYLFSARLEIDYINDEYKLHLPESEEYTTLAGMVLFYHQDLPKEGDEVIVGHFRLLITRVSETRIEELNLSIIRE